MSTLHLDPLITLWFLVHQKFSMWPVAIVRVGKVLSIGKGNLLAIELQQLLKMKTTQ